MMNEATTGTPEPAPETRLPHLAVRLIQVFVAPAALFDRLKRRPAWLGAVVLIVVLGLIVQAFIPEELIQQAILARLPRDANPEQLEAARGATGITNTFRWIGTVLFPPIAIAVIAGVLWLTYGALRGGEAGFRQLFAVTAHANLIPAVGAATVLLVLYVLVKSVIAVGGAG